MNIYSKILLAILPLVFCLVLSTVGTAYYFSRLALTRLAEIWLDARLSEAITAVVTQEAILHQYGLEEIPASIAKAQIDAGGILSAINVGEMGCIFAIHASGVIASHPDAGMIGKDVGREPWFRALTPQRSRLMHAAGKGRSLAVVDYFEPWKWYIIASDPEREIYGVANRMMPYLAGLVTGGFVLMGAVLMLLTRRLTDPLRQLTMGAEMIGRGRLDSRIDIGSRDEFGRLARMFNQMGEKLQQSHQQLEARVAERTAELFRANDQLRREIEEREQMSREKEKLQNQLLQFQKMEAIGTLAGGIAHDFNNLLMGIQGNIEMLALDMETDRRYIDRLGTIRDCIHSGSRLTQQLLGFARLGKYEVRATDPNTLVDKCAEMFGRTRQELRIVTDCQADVWTVNVDRGQIEQVLLNLLINAWQAMPEGGSITIRTSNETLSAEQVAMHQVIPGNYVRISVSDTGIGMDPATMARIFDPFFTTKTIKRGTGLGLASAYGIVRNHGGFIEVQSMLGQGATFNIYLKTLDAPISTAPPQRQLSLHRGSETILIVDDDAMIMDVGQAMLSALGYDVLTANGGQSAIDLYLDHWEDIDLVIMDMIMPDMGGGRAYDALKAINPAVKVLLASGYSIDGQASEILKRGCDGFIQKPFNLQALSEKVRELLDAVSSPAG